MKKIEKILAPAGLSPRVRGSDLIVMLTHGRTGLAHVLMGSVTKQVVRNAVCPAEHEDRRISPCEFQAVSPSRLPLFSMLL
jgi:Universal stress protein family